LLDDRVEADATVAHADDAPIVHPERGTVGVERKDLGRKFTLVHNPMLHEIWGS